MSLIHNLLLISIDHVVANSICRYSEDHGCLMLSAENIVSSENELGCQRFHVYALYKFTFTI